MQPGLAQITYFDGTQWTPPLTLFSDNFDLPQLSTSPDQTSETMIWGTYRCNVAQKITDPTRHPPTPVDLPAGSQRDFAFNHNGEMFNEITKEETPPTPLWGPMSQVTTKNSGTLVEFNKEFFLLFSDDNEYFSSQYNLDPKIEQYMPPALGGSNYGSDYPPSVVAYGNTLHLFWLDRATPGYVTHTRKLLVDDPSAQKKKGQFVQDAPFPLGPASARGAPSAVVYQSQLHLAYVSAPPTPNPTRLQLARFDGNYWSRPLTVALDPSRSALWMRPAIAVFKGYLYCFYTTPAPTDPTAPNIPNFYINYRKFNGAQLGEPSRVPGVTTINPDVASVTGFFTDLDAGTEIPSSTQNALQSRLFILTESPYRKFS